MTTLSTKSWKAPCSTFLAASIIVLGISFAGCSQKRETKTTTSSASDAAELLYQYPHSTEWSVSHMAYLSKNAKHIEGTSKDCNVCHLQRPAVKQLDVSCARSCHAPTTSGSSNLEPSRRLSNECASCHAGHYAKAKPHYPATAGLCRTCHDAKAEHLAGNAPKSVTTRPVEESCYSCHFRVDTRPMIHDAIKDGGCVQCHDPHGSDHRYFIKQKVEELCANCHDVGVEGAKTMHGIIKDERSCLNCHSPHSTQQQKLLKAASQDLCMKCHNKEIQTQFSSEPRILQNVADRVTNMPSHHGAVKVRDENGRLVVDKDACIKCHNPHASQFDRLFKNQFPNPKDQYNEYVPGDDKTPNTYALCFGCHHKKSVLEKDNKETGFRNDVKQPDNSIVSKNLHWYHVVDAAGSEDKTKGRSCNVCHDGHGAEQGHLVKAKWKMSPAFSVDIEYTAKPDGGECTKTCHDLRAYKRL